MKGKSSISKSAMWVLMGLLILGLAGFGVTNLGGNITRVGSVGEAEISVTDYAQALRSEINAAQSEAGRAISFPEVQAAGLDDQILARLVAEAALDDETRKMGISVGDEILREQILVIPAFRGMDGTFNREAYRFALDQAGLNEAQFEQNIRDETARTIVQGAVISGVSAPDAYTDTLLRYIAEERDITFATLDRGDLVTGLPTPTEADLRAYHQSNLPDFTTPEVKQITYAWLTPEMIIDDVEVDEASLREAYEARLPEFQQPERRLVERLVYPDAAAAEAALAALDAGSSFEDLVEERGLTLTDVDMGDVALDELGNAGLPVFAAETGDIVGPAETSLGPALFRINAVLQAQNTSFEEAEPLLRAELASDRAARVILGAVDGVDDLLAGGATLEEVGAETEMRTGTIEWHPGVSTDIAGYEGFREAAAAVQLGDFPEVGSLEDGGIFALRLDAVAEPAVQPFEDVRDAVQQGWTTEAITEALRAESATTVAALEDGASFEEQGLEPQVTEALTRRGFQPGTPVLFIETVFGLEPGDVAILEGEGTGRLFILRLDAVRAPSQEDEELAQLRRALADAAAADLSQDLYQALANDIRGRAGIEIDQQALNAVHANFR
ncbi:MAG: SurA N-terminal domain-containing protein [Roseovarius sp.]